MSLCFKVGNGIHTKIPHRTVPDCRAQRPCENSMRLSALVPKWCDMSVHYIQYRADGWEFSLGWHDTIFVSTVMFTSTATFSLICNSTFVITFVYFVCVCTCKTVSMRRSENNSGEFFLLPRCGTLTVIRYSCLTGTFATLLLPTSHPEDPVNTSLRQMYFQLTWEWGIVRTMNLFNLVLLFLIAIK